MQSFKILQKRIISQLDKESEKLNQLEPVNLYEPISYALQIGGKRLRPAMVLMACEMFGGQLDDAMSAAIGIEVFHNFTLLHDDIMDNAPLRRNMPTVYKKYSTNVAILSGDGMFNLCYQYFLHTNNQYLNEILPLFSQTANQVMEGQQYDMDFEKSEQVTIDSYLEMIKLKTAVLFACSLKIGAIIGGASPSDANRLYNFGVNLGLVFQLQDDLLDVYSEPDKFGKQTGGDIALNKKTFLLIKSLELANVGQKEELLRWLAYENFNIEEKVKAVKTIYDELEIQKTTCKAIEYFYNIAMNELSVIELPSGQKEELILLVNQIMKREN